MKHEFLASVIKKFLQEFEKYCKNTQVLETVILTEVF